MEGLEGNEGCVAEIWIKCQEGVHIFVVCFWHCEVWSVRDEALVSAVLKRVANTRSHWIIAELKLKHRHKEAPRPVLRAQEEWKCGERYIALWSANHLNGKSKKVDVVSEYLTSPQKAVRGTVRSQKMEKWINKFEVLVKLPGASGGNANDECWEENVNKTMKQ